MLEAKLGPGRCVLVSKFGGLDEGLGVNSRSHVAHHSCWHCCMGSTRLAGVPDTLRAGVGDAGWVADAETKGSSRADFTAVMLLDGLGLYLSSAVHSAVVLGDGVLGALVDGVASALVLGVCEALAEAELLREALAELLAELLCDDVALVLAVH